METVLPRRGTVALFSSGWENMHEVRCGRHRGRALLAPRLLHHAAAPGGRAVARCARRARARPCSSRGGAVGALALSRNTADPIWLASAARTAGLPRLAYGWGSLRHDLAPTEASGEPAG
eukprot:scaffold130291_cov69-Phaeocystis_antarctica.AAC.1